MSHSFAMLGLDPTLARTLSEKGYSAPTDIQAAVIPAMLSGRDVIGQSQTGSGKTAAFAVPILQAIRIGAPHIQGLVLTPTRELALQVTGAIGRYGRDLGVRVMAVYGGQSYARQVGSLKKGVDIVVGTPGRVLDLMEKQLLKLDKVSHVVLDEADEMLSMGFIDDIETILGATPGERQTGLFSATLSAPVRRLASRFQKDPLACTLDRERPASTTVEQRYYLVNEADRLAALIRLFETEPIVSALVFSRTRIATGELANELAARGVSAEALNGDLGQEARERVLQRFRSGQVKVLVATDVAARGLDIDHVSHVFNYDLPQDPELYVHRIGRTGRAGKAGVAITLLTPRERWFLRRIESLTQQKMTPAQIPTPAEIQAIRDARLVEKMTVWLNRGRCRKEGEIVADLVAQGHDAAQIAAAALKLIRVGEKERPVPEISELAPEPQKTPRSAPKRPARFKKQAPGRGLSNEEGMVRLTLDGGRADGLNPGYIVGTLSRHTGIPGQCIGRIRIEEKTAFVDVPEAVADQVLARTAAYRIGGQRIAVARA